MNTSYTPTILRLTKEIQALIHCNADNSNDSYFLPRKNEHRKESKRGLSPAWLVQLCNHCFDF